MSKGDKPMPEFLAHERNGKKSAERFNLDGNELIERDKIAREELKTTVDKGKQESIATGKQSQKGTQNNQNWKYRPWSI